MKSERPESRAPRPLIRVPKLIERSTWILPTIRAIVTRKINRSWVSVESQPIRRRGWPGWEPTLALLTVETQEKIHSEAETHASAESAGVGSSSGE